jgi:hypothetical protein
MLRGGSYTIQGADLDKMGTMELKALCLAYRNEAAQLMRSVVRSLEGCTAAGGSGGQGRAAG